MTKEKNKENWVRMRSLFFVPAHIEKFYEKAVRSNADIIVLDLEDGVPFDKKEVARSNLADFLGKSRYSKKILVRTNPLDSPEFDFDFAICMEFSADGIVLPKTVSANELVRVEAKVRNYNDSNKIRHLPRLFPLIENAEAVLNLREITGATELIQGLVFGAEDYLNDIGALPTRNELNLLFARTQIVLAARERGVVAIDTPFLGLKDYLGCAKHARLGKEYGFQGMLVIHPDQVDIANEEYSPSLSDIDNAQQLISLNDDAQRNKRSIVFAEGRFVGPPIIKRAEALIRRARDLGMIRGD